MRCSALALLLLSFALPVGAVPIVDQEAAFDGGTLWHDNDSRGFQTFTVAQDGMLVRLDLLVTANTGFRFCLDENGGDSGLCRVTLRGVSGVVASPFADPEPGWLTLDFAPLAVTAGEVIRIQIFHEGVLGFGSAIYDRGELTHICNEDPCIDPFVGDPFAPLPGDTVLGPLAVDYAFRAWIEPTLIAEPSARALLVTGGALLRRRKR